MSQDKTKNRNHIPWPNKLNTGRGNMPLDEPVPSYLARKGDELIQAKVDNNACIVLGRDRNPFGPPKSRVPHGSEEDPNNPKSSRSEVSGFSDHMGAGAIDLIVGRGAPFAMQKLQHDMFPQGLPPLYLTRKPQDLGAKKLTAGPHPGYLMDAARIYMSQMCQIDDYFKIAKIKLELTKGKITTVTSEDKGPCSAIMLKADKLRLHSRRDIFIVAGGDFETTHDSNNNSITESGRIHLVSRNGLAGKNSTPAVRSAELKECLKAMMKTIQGSTEILNNFLKMQKELNYQLAHAIYGTAVGMSTSNPICQALESVADPALMKDLLQVHALKTYNIPSIEASYLISGAQRDIASKYVTLN